MEKTSQKVLFFGNKSEKTRELGLGRRGSTADVGRGVWRPKIPKPKTAGLLLRSRTRMRISRVGTANKQNNSSPPPPALLLLLISLSLSLSVYITINNTIQYTQSCNSSLLGSHVLFTGRRLYFSHFFVINQCPFPPRNKLGFSLLIHSLDGAALQVRRNRWFIPNSKEHYMSNLLLPTIYFSCH